jgi:hypothetical protein
MRAWTRRATGVLVALLFLLTPVVFGAESFTYGFIRSNLDCNTGKKPRRVRLVSQIFQFCLLEVPSSQVIRDNEVFFRQVARTACEGDFSVSYQSLVTDKVLSTITQDHKDALTESGYDKVQEWTASVEYPSSKCR